MVMVVLHIQGDTSRCAKPPVDFKTKVPFWPGLAKAELLFSSQQEVWHNMMCHPVEGRITDTQAVYSVSLGAAFEQRSGETSSLT